MDPIRVLIVDDHEIVRAGLLALLSREKDIDVVATASNAEEALVTIRRLEPDVAVVDYSLPGMTGVELCERVVVAHPGVAVVLLTTYLDDNVIHAALKAGARAYVYKDVEALELRRAIRVVAEGGSVLDPKIAGRVANWAHDARSPGGDLSRRETEVLRLVAKGTQNKEIGQALGLSENTIRTYVRRILTKLDCHSRSEAAALAARRGLL